MAMVMAMNEKRLSFDDYTRLVAELDRLPAWGDGGRVDRKGVLRAIGLPDSLVNSLHLSGTSTDTPNLITTLQTLGHLVNRPTHYALGALVEYLFRHTPHVEGKLFLASLLDRYDLITDLTYLAQLERGYQLPRIPPADRLLDLGWAVEQPTFTWHGPAEPDRLEAIWSQQARFLDAVFLEKGARAARAVCRVETGIPLGSGFLVGANLVLTNHHVLPTDDAAEQARVRFGYRMDLAGQLQPGETHAVNRALRRSPPDELDYVLLELASAPGQSAETGWLPAATPELAAGQSAFIIQHPQGEPQKVVLQDNWITYVAPDQRRVQYLTNTEHGSSGSPVCDGNWDVVALHHSGKPYPTSPQTEHLRGNEGIPMAAILPEIQDLLGG